MDPDTALENAREALRKYNEATEAAAERDGDESSIAKFTDPKLDELVREERAEASYLAEAFEAIDGWLSKGGFLPKAWERK